MIPIRDSIRSRRVPYVTLGLIGANALVFVYQLTLPAEQLRELYLTYAMIPARVGHPLTLLIPSHWPEVASVLTAMFLHAGWFHFLGNMLYLWVFGDNVEDSMGPARFLVFYLAVGAVGNLSHAVTNLTSQVPTVGASGAIAGVLGAYFMSFPRARVLALIPIGLFVTITEVPAVLFLLLWFLLQLVSGLASLGGGIASGTAWWAHIGGFVAGVLLVAAFRRRRQASRAAWWEQGRQR